jgi:uroporphyrinogen III methyltransferase/synthase
MNETVLVIREYDKFSEMLVQAKFEVVNFPAIQTTPIEDLDELNAKLGAINDYDGLFFTSPKAAEVFLERVRERNFAFGGKVYVLGNRTRTLFENFGKADFEIVFRENANTAEGLINSFESREFAGKKFLFLRGDKSLRTIPELVKDVAAIDEIIVYRTIENSFDKVLVDVIRQKIEQNQIGWICFFSPSGIESYINAFGETSLENVKTAVIGETTARRAAEKKLKVDFISAKANAEDYARGLINRIKEIE